MGHCKIAPKVECFDHFRSIYMLISRDCLTIFCVIQKIRKLKAVNFIKIVTTNGDLNKEILFYPSFYPFRRLGNLISLI